MSADETGTSSAREREAPGIVDLDPASPRAAEHRTRLRRWAIVGGVLVLLVTGSVTLSYTPIFGASVIEVEGEQRLAARRVLRIAGVELGSNVFHLDVTSTEARLETEPWILGARVETTLPGTITISVRERRPVLMLEDGEGVRRLVAADGTVLGRAPWAAGLPEVVPAPGAALDAGALAVAGQVVRAIAPALRSRVDAITVGEDRMVSLLVDDGVEVRYGGAADAEAKGQALRAILAYADEQGRGLVSVDVSSPATPTARFVGSQLPMSVPDPSADVPDAGDGEAGTTGVAASPSPSP